MIKNLEREVRKGLSVSGRVGVRVSDKRGYKVFKTNREIRYMVGGKL